MVVRKQVQYYLSDFLEIVTKALKIQNDTILIQFGKKTKGFLNFPFYSSESRHSNQTALQVSTVHFSLDLHADLLQRCLKTEYHLCDFLCLHVTAICTFLSLILGQVACGGGKYFWFCTAHNPLNMDIFLPYKWKSVLELGFCSCSLSCYRGFF